MTLLTKKIDILTQDAYIALLNTNDCDKYGINPGDQIYITWEWDKMGRALMVDSTPNLVPEGHIGIFNDFWLDINVPEGTVVDVEILVNGHVRDIIAKKLSGEVLSEDELDKVIGDIASGRTTPPMVAYFVAAGYSPGFNEEEIYNITKSMSKHGDKLAFEGLVLDKHSVGGVAGKGITPLIIPIISTLDNVVVPNTSSKAVTSASATADMLEGIMEMSFSKNELYEFVKKENCFMVWGGGLEIAPADDKIIRIQKLLGIESHDKLVSSIMAKKISQGANNVLFDLPYGKYAKLKDEATADEIIVLFEKMAAKFGMNLIFHKREVRGIDGNAVGPNLECKEFLRIYEGHDDASESMLDEALTMAGKLIELSGQAKKGEGKNFAAKIMSSGKAYDKLKRIIKMQNGNPDIESDDLKVGKYTYEIKSIKSGKITYLNNKAIFNICKYLGNPHIREAGIYFHKNVGDSVKSNDLLATLYATSDLRISLGVKSLEQNQIFDIEE